MPYVEQARAEKLRAGATPHNGGELSFLISDAVRRYMEAEPLSYMVCAEVLGAYDSSKNEFVRTVLEPYEDGKRKLNGWDEGVFPPHSRRLVDAAAVIEDSLIRANRRR